MTESLYLQYYMPSTATYTFGCFLAAFSVAIFADVLCLSTVDIISVYQSDCLTDKLVSYCCTRLPWWLSWLGVLYRL